MHAQAMGELKSADTAILLVAFGTSRQEAHLSLMRLEESARERFPDIPVRWAFSSGKVRSKLADAGMKTDSSAKALEKIWFEKYARVAVQSLHVIPGAEYHELVEVAEGFRRPPKSFEAVELGRPLINGEEDARRAARAVMANVPEQRGPQDAVVLMGHGTGHPGDAVYDLLMRELAELDDMVFLATIEGSLSIESAREELLRRGAKRAFLMPLLAVAGRHVQKDMAGPGPDSWKSILESAGLECLPVAEGTAGRREFSAIWLDHLAEALSRLD
jgi:sirohydrochlorin cobaltochelatase